MGIGIRTTLHLGWSRPRPPGCCLFMWPLAAPLPHRPAASCQRSRHKKPLTRRTKFHWPSFVDLSGMAEVSPFERQRQTKKTERTPLTQFVGFVLLRGEAADCCPPARPPLSHVHVPPSHPLLQTHRKSHCHLLHGLSRCKDKAQ